MRTITTELVFSDTAMTADRTSNVVDVEQMTGYSVHFVATGTPTGDLIIQKSNDNVNWVNHATDIATGGAAVNDIIEVADCYHKYVRAFYDFGSGTGTLGTCTLVAKEG